MRLHIKVVLVSSWLLGALTGISGVAAAHHNDGINKQWWTPPDLENIARWDCNSSISGTCVGSGASASQIDWAVHLVYTQNATVNKVKNQIRNNYIGDSYNGPGSPKFWEYYEQTANPPHPVVDSDSGISEGNCFQTHVRFYASPITDSLGYDQDWGYYVIATAHRDKNHVSGCPNADQFGWSEGAAAEITSDDGSWFSSETITLNNDEPSTHWDASLTNYYASDGVAYKVPAP